MSFDPTNKIAPFPERAVDLESGFARYEPLVTPQKLKDQYLFGIPLKSKLTGQELSDDTLKDFITRAVSEAEHTLRISISPVKYQDRYDYILKDYLEFNYIQLNHWPVLQIESFKAKFPNAVDFIQYPKEWISLYGEAGVFQITPTTGMLTTFFLTNDASYIPLLLGGRMNWPQLFEITYVCGFELDKLPALINELIGTIAMVKALELLTSVIFPVLSYSIGIDGVSQGVVTPGPQFFSERIARAEEKVLKLTDIIKRYYNKAFQVTSI
jgi:hypothetical protein